MDGREHEQYGLRTLKQLRDEFERLGQFDKYPFDIGGPSWILREIEREEEHFENER